MEDLIQFLTLTPQHTQSIDEKMERVYNLKNLLTDTNKTFTDFSQKGEDMCKSMGKLRRLFKRIGRASNDPTIDILISVLGSFTNTLKGYFKQVVEIVVSSLDDFINNEIECACETYKDASHKCSEYLEYTDKLVSYSKKKSEDEYINRDRMRLIYHWKAIESSFNLSNAIERVERKKLIETTAVFLSFIQLTAVSFKQCYFDFDANKEAFQALQTAIPASQQSIEEFSTIVARNGKTLHGLFSAKIVNPTGIISEDVIDYEGYLWKKSTGITKAWNRRYFVCKDNVLSYYHKYDKTTQPNGELPLLLTSVKPINDPERRNCFQVISQDACYVLQALNESEMRVWLQIIQNNIQYLLNNTVPISPKAEQEEEPKSIVPPFYVNEVCADCGAPNPVWCCINWGTIICIHCSGVHRSLNTTVSKVRSLTLDHIDNLTIELMQRIGNKFANSVLEEGVGTQKISQNADKQEREVYIRKKYSQAAFITPNIESFDHLSAIKEGNIELVYKAICYGRILRENNGYGSLHMAASCDDPLITLLLSYNATNINSLDECGWSALSYAAYYGKYQNAEILINSGCDPTRSTAAHPYEVSKSVGNQELAALFLPFWNGNQDEPPRSFEPPISRDLSAEERTAKIRKLKISALQH